MSNTSDLLHLVKFEQADLRKEHIPLLMEFQVNPETAPYLVSSSASVMWIRRAHGERVRAAVREVDIPTYSRAVVTEVFHMGQQTQWGNTTELSLEGVEACVAHLQSYGLDKVVILTHPKVPWGNWGVDIAEPWEDKDIIEASWLPGGMVVVVPEDRGFLGTIWRVGDDRLLSVVHNASRGMAVCWDGE